MTHQRRRAVRPAAAEKASRISASAQPAQRGSARGIAFEALCAIEERPVFLRAVLDELCAAFDVEARERGLALELAAGVTRRRATLDAVLAPHIRAPEGRIEPRLRTVLRIGAYQLLFLATPAHAAVYETVELARSHQPRWSRLVNGVLRAVQRDLRETISPGPARDAVPVCTHRESGVQVEYRQLHSAAFPPPETDFVGYVAAAFSLPQWLAARWHARYGDAELLRLGAWFATPGRVTLRVNRLRATREEVLNRLRSAGVAAAESDAPDGIRLLENARVERLPGFAEGLFSVQDESAQGAAELLDPQAGQVVLDLCAAPGGKSAALAERMRNEGRIVAADTDAARVALIGTGAARLGIAIIEPLVVRADSGDMPAGPFDRILLDVPCSNTGVLGKRPEARWRISEAGIGELTAVQSGLLRVALDRLAVGGQLVYSTCSIEPEENEGLVRDVLAERKDVAVVSERQYQPGVPGDGGYQALLVNGPSSIDNCG